MKRIKIAAMAVMAFVGLTEGSAQLCPDCAPLAQRPIVKLSTLVNANEELPAGVTTLDRDNVYYLDTKVYVMSGSTLKIESGTVIKGIRSGTALTANAVIVTRGAKIEAVGTPECPIIFTAQTDQLNGTFPLDSAARWGGIILLGKAHNNNQLGDDALVPTVADGAGNGVKSIEGLSTPDTRHWYGANSWTDPSTRLLPIFDDADNSGIMQYVSIRHGGAVIGLANEINGLTLGSVGSGTIIDHVEVISNEDDGFEFFGGTVNVKYCAAMFCKDDGFDTDQYYSGKGQFLYVLQHPCFDEWGIYSSSVYGSGLELDGNDKTGRTPNSDYVFFNVTAIGNNTASSAGMEPKAQTNGEVSNSLFLNFPIGVKMNSSVQPFYPEGNLWRTRNNSFENVANLFTPDASAEETQFTADGNLGGPSLSPLTGIDYSLEATGCGAYPNANTITGKIDAIPDDVTSTRTSYYPPAGFDAVQYRGAFAPGSDSWLNKWSGLDVKKLELSTIECPTDVNADGQTNGSDYLELLGNIFSTCQ